MKWQISRFFIAPKLTLPTKNAPNSKYQFHCPKQFFYHHHSSRQLLPYSLLKCDDLDSGKGTVFSFGFSQFSNISKSFHAANFCFLLIFSILWLFVFPHFPSGKNKVLVLMQLRQKSPLNSVKIFPPHSSFISPIFFLFSFTIGNPSKTAG